MIVVKRFRIPVLPDNLEQIALEGWSTPVNYVRAFTLSCIKILNFFEQIVVYTTYEGKQFIEKYLSDYKLVTIVLPELQNNAELEKFFICSIQTQPFLYIDNDVYINQPLHSHISTYDVVVQWRNSNLSNANILSEDIKYIPGEVQSDHLYDFNTGIIGGNNVNFFAELYEHIKSYFDNTIKNLSYEQEKYIINSYLLGAFATEKNTTISLYHPLPLICQYTFSLFKMISEYAYFQIPERLKPFIELQNILNLSLQKINFLYFSVNNLKEYRYTLLQTTEEKFLNVRKAIAQYLGNPFLLTEINPLEDNLKKSFDQLSDSIEKKLLNDFYQYQLEKINFEKKANSFFGRLEEKAFSYQSEPVVYQDHKITLAETVTVLESNWNWIVPKQPVEFLYLQLMHNKYKAPDEFVVLYYYDYFTESFIEEKLEVLGVIIVDTLQEPKLLSELIDKAFQYLQATASSKDFKEILSVNVINNVQRWIQNGLIIRG